jgi:hypothetical protein
MAAWEKPESPLKSKIQPTRSQRYDRSAVVWVQNTMAVREESSNRYDGTPGQNAIRKKDVTAAPAPNRFFPGTARAMVGVQGSLYDQKKVRNSKHWPD